MIEVFTIFISAFIGTWFAYYFSIREKLKEQKKLIHERYFILSENITTLFSNLIFYKSDNLDKIKKAYDDNDVKKSLQVSLKPDILFTIDISQYIFLAAANSKFLISFKDLERMTNHLSHSIDDYFSIIQQINKNNLSTPDYDAIKNLFYNLYNKYEEVCVYTYFILSQMNKFYDGYFNLNYLGNIKETFEQGYNLEKDIENYKERFPFSTWENEFSKIWIHLPHFKCHLCFIKRWMKFKIKFIKFYFSKPAFCNSCSASELKNNAIKKTKKANESKN